MSQAKIRAAILAFLLLGVAYFTLAPFAYADAITLSSNPDCVSWGQDRIDCVARASDNALWHTWWSSGSWSGWESFGGVLTSGPSITSFAPGRLDMFVEGADNALWHIVWDGSLHSWESLGGKLTSDPDCTSAGFGIIDCFVRGPDKALWHLAFNAGAWSAWESVGGVLTSGPGAASVMAQGHELLVVSVRGADNAMWQTGWADTSQAWTPWEKSGGILTSDPDSVGSMDPQDPTSFTYRFDFVVRGPDNGIWWKWTTVKGGPIENSVGCQGCDGYEKLGGISNSGPTIASRGWNNLEVFALGTDNKLYHRGWDGSIWSPWDAVPMIVAATTLTTSSTVVVTSLESSTVVSSSAATSIISPEMSSLMTSSSPSSANIGTTDLTGMLQQNGVLIVGVIVLIAIVFAFASRARQKRLGAQKPQQSRTSVFCPNCGAQNPPENAFCARCGGKVHD